MRGEKIHINKLHFGVSKLKTAKASNSVESKSHCKNCELSSTVYLAFGGLSDIVIFFTSVLLS